MHPSDTPPATSVGMCVVIDTQTLCAKSPRGNLYYIDSIDEFSGDVQVTPAKSLKAVDIFSALMSLVHTRYNAYGHRVVHFVSDSLPALEAVVPMLGMMGILHSLCAPGQYSNSRSRPSTADILVTGRPRTLNARIPYIKFGDTCMVPVSVDKRHKVACVSKMELCVSGLFAQLSWCL